MIVICIWKVHFSFSHFEDQTIEQPSGNQTFEYEALEITDRNSAASSLIYKNNIDSETSTNYLGDNVDDGEFLDTTAEVMPNEIKQATCGDLITK